MTLALAEKVDGAKTARAPERTQQFDLFKLWIWYALARGLSLDAAVEAAQKLTTTLRTENPKIEPDKETVVELLFAPSNTMSKLAKYLAVTTPAVELAKERADELDRLQARCRMLEQSLADATAKWQDLQRRADEQVAALDAAKQRIEELDRGVLDERASHAHRMRNARGRFIKFMERDIGPRLANAIEAIVGQPPYLDVADDRLKSINLLIDAEVKKLRDDAE